MPFDIVDRFRDSIESTDGSATTLDELNRPDDVTVERVTDELNRAIASEDLSVERSGFNNQSDIIEIIEPLVGDYHKHHNSLALLNQFQTGWESDTHQNYSDAIDHQVDDEVVEVVKRHEAEVVSVLRGFESTGPIEWIREYSGRYPAVGCLIEYVYARNELEEHSYIE